MTRNFETLCVEALVAQVYIAGGSTASGTCHDSLWTHDAETDLFHVVAKEFLGYTGIATPTCNAQYVLTSDGTIYVLGHGRPLAVAVAGNRISTALHHLTTSESVRDIPPRIAKCLRS